MSVLYAPRLADLRIPEHAVVAFSIDPVACVARLKDPEATAAAALLPRHKHLAIVGMLLNVSIRKPPTRQALTQKFHYASRGRLPDPAFACLALSEEFASTLPEPRPPLLPTPPLPFTDCCVHTLDTFSARLTAIHLTDPEKVSRVTNDQMKRLLDTWLADAGTQHAANPVSPEDGQQGAPLSLEGTPSDPVHSISNSSHTSSRSALHPPSKPGSTHGASQHGAGTHTEGSSSEGDSDENSHSESDDDDDDDDDDEEDEESIEEDDDDNDGFDPDGYLLGEIWLELSPQDEFGTAAQLVEVSDQLNDIKERSRRKAMLTALADQPETTKWAEGVASAGSLDPHPDPEASSSTSEISATEDALVVPEDAIEHRFEKDLPAAAAPAKRNEESAENRAEKEDAAQDETISPAQAGPSPPSPPPRTRLRKFVHYVGKRVKGATTKVSRRVKTLAHYFHK